MLHVFDLARGLLGEEPTEVLAAGSCLVDQEIGALGDVDTALVILKTPSGRLCQISCSRRASYGYDQRVEVLGSKGMVRADNVRLSSVEIADQDGFHGEKPPHFFIERYAEAYRAELDHFAACLEQGQAPSPSGEDGRRALALADAATESRATGRAGKPSGAAGCSIRTTPAAWRGSPAPARRSCARSRSIWRWRGSTPAWRWRPRPACR
jgi:myo-inositol 2-dehydrogenase/D-chiro-inositol 1-dehydrogenase